METEILFAIIRYAVAAAVGFVVGVVFSRGKLRKDGHEIPVIERTTLNFTLVTVVLLVLSLVAVVNTAVAANKQSDCNAEFLRVIKERSAFTAEDGKLRDRLDELSNNEEAALLPLAQNLAGGATRDQIADDIQNLEEVINANVAERAEIAQTQEEIAKKRAQNPYPDPQC